MFISLMKNGGNFGQNPWETPIGKIVEGMDHVKQFYGGYGDMPPVRRCRCHHHGSSYQLFLQRHVGQILLTS
jgi:hypothetical protein